MTQEQENEIYSLLLGASVHLGKDGAEYVAKMLTRRIIEILVEQ